MKPEQHTTMQLLVRGHELNFYSTSGRHVLNEKLADSGWKQIKGPDGLYYHKPFGEKMFLLIKVFGDKVELRVHKKGDEYPKTRLVVNAKENEEFLKNDPDKILELFFEHDIYEQLVLLAQAFVIIHSHRKKSRKKMEGAS